MKRAYSKHVYSGHRVNPKRSRAAILRYHGSDTAGRRQAWRDDDDRDAQKTQPQPTTSIESNRLFPVTGLSDDERYKAVHSSQTQAHYDDGTNALKTQLQSTKSSERNHSESPMNLQCDDKKYKAVHSSRTQAKHDDITNVQKTQLHPTKSSECSHSESPVNLQCLSDDKKCKAVHSSKPNANLLPHKQKSPEELHASTASITWPPRDPEVEKHELTIEVEKESPHNFEGLDGYRIVDIKHVLNWAINLQSEHSKECTCAKVNFVDEVRDGLSSIYKFECVMCKKKWHMCSEEKNKINKSFVWGTLTSASYFSQSTHMLAIMDIPSMSENKYRTLETKFGEVWQQQLCDEMQEAAKQERDIAIQKGHVGSDGVPYICVFVDGGWCKRSYGHNFNASSGVACIIGVETKKCLFLGIKNKFCNICAHNEKKGEEKEHLCFRNYKGSSTAMEVDILVEGFSKSVELHGLRYTSFVGDGDSSVFARLKDKVPYGNIITKKECKNHVMKNFTSALYKITGDTKLPLAGRKVLGAKLKKLTTVARLNLKHNSDNVAKMRQDLKNCPLHVFGQHNDCDTYYCRWKMAEQNNELIDADKNLVPELKKHVAVWALIETAIENIVRKADRLLGNLTNNVAENFMSLMAKYNCGKRINLSRGGSYHRRAQIAGLCQIKGQQWQADAWKKASNQSPGSHLKKYLSRVRRSAELRKKGLRKRIFTKPVVNPVQNADKDYGPKADDPPVELTESELKKECEEKLQKLQIHSLDEIDAIQKDKTIGQHSNEKYVYFKENRLTASQFGMVCKRRKSTPCHNHVKAILYKQDFSNADTTYGQSNEKIAIKLFEKDENKTVISSGLFIDHEYGFLGASPDGLVVGENAVVEVKCFPSLARKGSTFEDAAKGKKPFPLQLDTNGQFNLDTKHNYYYQIQGQLRVAKKDYCYLVCFIDMSKPIVIIKIQRDEEFIQQMMEKLVIFYKTCVLPEIVLRRIPANQMCRDPPSFSATKKKEAKKKN